VLAHDPLPQETSASARASAQNSGTDNSSAREDGMTPAAVSSGSTGMPSVLRLERNILRRWPNAAAVTRSSAGLAAGANGAVRGTNDTTLEVTFGAGTKAEGGTSNRIFGALSHCTMTDNRP